MKPYYDHAGIQIYLGDCREILPGLPRPDAIVTDLPYGINACRMTLGKGKKEFHRGDWDGQKPELGFLLSAAQWLCIWGGNYFAGSLPESNDWLIWHKLNDGRSFSECEMAWTNYGLQTRHLSHHWAGEIKDHPTQKPEDVIRWAIRIIPDNAQLILDPFMGSGTTLVAAKNLGRKAIGIDIEERYCEIAAKRLARKSSALTRQLHEPPSG